MPSGTAALICVQTKVAENIQSLPRLTSSLTALSPVLISPSRFPPVKDLHSPSHDSLSYHYLKKRILIYTAKLSTPSSHSTSKLKIHGINPFNFPFVSHTISFPHSVTHNFIFHSFRFRHNFVTFYTSSYSPNHPHRLPGPVSKFHNIGTAVSSSHLHGLYIP